MKSKRITPITMALLIAICILIIPSAQSQNAIAQSSQTTINKIEQESSLNPSGVLTKLTLNLGYTNDEVFATVKNSFTLLPSTIMIYLELYSSYDYQSSYTDMTLEKRAYCPDLNIGSSLEVRVSKNGETKYWKARVFYKFDKREWTEKVTDTMLFD